MPCLLSKVCVFARHFTQHVVLPTEDALCTSVCMPPARLKCPGHHIDMMAVGSAVQWAVVSSVQQQSQVTGAPTENARRDTRSGTVPVMWGLAPLSSLEAAKPVACLRPSSSSPASRLESPESKEPLYTVTVHYMASRGCASGPPFDITRTSTEEEKSEWEERTHGTSATLGFERSELRSMVFSDLRWNEQGQLFEHPVRSINVAVTGVEELWSKPDTAASSAVMPTCFPRWAPCGGCTRHLAYQLHADSPRCCGPCSRAGRGVDLLSAAQPQHAEQGTTASLRRGTCTACGKTRRLKDGTSVCATCDRLTRLASSCQRCCDDLTTGPKHLKLMLQGRAYCQDCFRAMRTCVECDRPLSQGASADGTCEKCLAESVQARWPEGCSQCSGALGVSSFMPSFARLGPSLSVVCSACCGVEPQPTPLVTEDAAQRLPSSPPPPPLLPLAPTPHVAAPWAGGPVPFPDWQVFRAPYAQRGVPATRVRYHLQAPLPPFPCAPPQNGWLF